MFLREYCNIVVCVVGAQSALEVDRPVEVFDKPQSKESHGKHNYLNTALQHRNKHRYVGKRKLSKSYR